MSTAPLNIGIVTGDSRPIFKQIVDGIGLKIATGELMAGDRLPSVRALAQQLGINPNTVAKAYSELTNTNQLVSRRGLGLFVKERGQMFSEEEREARLEHAVSQFVHEVINLDFSVEEMLTRLEEQLRHVSRLDRE